MTVQYVSNGDPNKIPQVGQVINLGLFLQFKVEGYGESHEQDYPSIPAGKVYWIELHGVLILLKGAPVEMLEKIFSEELPL